MRIEVNGVRLFFDVEGAKLVPDGPTMRERPTLIVLHGGPGGDHSDEVPWSRGLADICQIVYLDHRGNGRSDRASTDSWNLAQWGDDVFAFARALEIEKPIVYGVSFGAAVALSYATRHPEQPGKLIINGGWARFDYDAQHEVFERLGGPEARAASERMAAATTDETLAEFLRVCMPLYTRQPLRDPYELRRAITNRDCFVWFERVGGENRQLDMRKDLDRIACPTLVMGGEDDPAVPIQHQEEIAASIRPDLVRFERFANAGHGIINDAPGAIDVIREFILS